MGEKHDKFDLASCIITLILAIQVLAFVLKIVGVINCSWFVTLLPLIVFLSVVIIVVFILMIYIIFDKDGRNIE